MPLSLKHTQAKDSVNGAKKSPETRATSDRNDSGLRAVLYTEGNTLGEFIKIQSDVMLMSQCPMRDDSLNEFPPEKNGHSKDACKVLTLTELRSSSPPIPEKTTEPLVEAADGGNVCTEALETAAESISKETRVGFLQSNDKECHLFKEIADKLPKKPHEVEFR